MCLSPIFPPGDFSRVEYRAGVKGDINGANSVELVLRRDGYHLSTFWLLRGNEVVRVSFRVPDARFPRWQDQLRTAGKSITLR